jgi:hypothetical protein
MPRFISHLPRGPSCTTPAGERRINECVADALEDREELSRWYALGLRLLLRLHEDRVTLCDAGCGIDLQGIVESLKPWSVEEVRRVAEEVARDREQD